MLTVKTKQTLHVHRQEQQMKIAGWEALRYQLHGFVAGFALSREKASTQ